VKPTLSHSNVDVDLRIQESCMVYSYPAELIQAVVSILNNSKDALNDFQESNKKITIRTFTKNDTINIQINDNGGGIKPLILGRIFEPYFTTKHKSQGSGLGLYIAKTVIENSLQGQLSVQNNYQGAVFTITLSLCINNKKLD